MSETIALPSTLSFGGLLSYGWQVLQKHFTYLLKVVVVMIVLVAIPQAVVGMLFKESALGGIFNLLLTIWQMILSLGILRIMLELLRTGKEPELTQEKLLEGKDVIVNYIVGQILFGLLVAVGMILLVIPGFYFMLKYMFVPILIADKKFGIKEAFAFSAQMTEGKKLTLLFYMLGIYFFILLGLLALIIGVVVTGAIASIAGLGMYLILEREASKAQA